MDLERQSLGQTLPVASLSLGQTASGSEVGVFTVAAAADFQGTQNWWYKRYLDGHAKLTSICLINICQICVIESYDIMYTRQDCV